MYLLAFSISIMTELLRFSITLGIAFSNAHANAPAGNESDGGASGAMRCGSKPVLGDYSL